MIRELSDIATCHVADITQGETLDELARVCWPKRRHVSHWSGFRWAVMWRRRLPGLRRSGSCDSPCSIHQFVPTHPSEQPFGAHWTRQPVCRELHGFGDRLLATYPDPSHLTDSDIVARIRGMTERLGPETFVRQNNIERKDGADVLRSLACPILILCGENDALTPLADHKEMAALAPHAKLVVVPGSGHLAPMEAPQAVAQALRTWLSEPE